MFILCSLSSSPFPLMFGYADNCHQSVYINLYELFKKKVVTGVAKFGDDPVEPFCQFLLNWIYEVTYRKYFCSPFIHRLLLVFKALPAGAGFALPSLGFHLRALSRPYQDALAPYARRLAVYFGSQARLVYCGGFDVHRYPFIILVNDRYLILGLV